RLQNCSSRLIGSAISPTWQAKTNLLRSTRLWLRSSAVNSRPTRRSKLPMLAFGDEVSLQSASDERSHRDCRLLVKRSPSGARGVEDKIRTTVELLADFPCARRSDDP